MASGLEKNFEKLGGHHSRVGGYQYLNFFLFFSSSLLHNLSIGNKVIQANESILKLNIFFSSNFIPTTKLYSSIQVFIVRVGGKRLSLNLNQKKS